MNTKQHSSQLVPAGRSLLALLVALPALASVACGGSDDSPSSSAGDGQIPANFPKDRLPKELVKDLPIIAPTSDKDIPLFSGIVDIAPGDDVTFCTWTDVVLDHDTIFAESFGAESPEGHHAILQYTTQVQDPHTGDCGAMDGNMLLGGSGGKNVADTATLPKNFGVKVPAGSQLVINHHWINGTDQAVKGQAMMLARPLPDGGDTVLAGSFPMLGLGWNIPAQGQLEYSTECTYTEDVSYVLALGHMHEYGQHVNIDVQRAAGGTESLIDLPWSPDSGTTAGGRIFTLDDPYVIHKGDTVKLTCDWANNTAEDIGFPREMCIFFGYTVGTNAFCANGAWLTPDQVASTGVNPQDITNNL